MNSTGSMNRRPAGWMDRRARGKALCYGVVFAVLCLAGCSPETPPKAAPDLARGVISMAPNITEAVFAMGQQSRLIAVGKFDDYPPEANAFPRVGGAIDPDLEKITQLRPGLILTSGEVPKVRQYGLAHGVAVENVAMDNFQGIADGIGRIGALLQCEAAAAALRAAMDAQRRAVEEAVAGKPRPKVLLVTGRMSHDLNMLPTAGGPSFLTEMTALAGGENIHANEKQAYFEASKETVVKAAPEVILEFHCGENLDEADRAAFVRDWEVLSTLPAVRNGRIYIITEPHAMRPGPRVFEVARLLARLLHPDAEGPR